VWEEIPFYQEFCDSKTLGGNVVGAIVKQERYHELSNTHRGECTIDRDDVGFIFRSDKVFQEME
jgi:hypothetical protein